MNHALRLLLLATVLLLLAAPASAQWRCLYATWDEETNGTGTNTIGVGVIGENKFVALIAEGNPTVSNYLIPYVNADSSMGRLYGYPYGLGQAIFQTWTDGSFDQVGMFNAFQVVADPQGYIYVANNDPEHNILVFKLTDTVTTAPIPTDPNIYPRTPTGTNRIWGIDIDQAGNVYVCVDTSIGITQDLKIYPPITQWDAFHSTTPLQTIDLPDGVYKGITVSPDGKAVYVCQYDQQTILRYTGDIAGGYTRDLGFGFQRASWDTIRNQPTRLPAPISVKLLQPNNILFTAMTSLFAGGLAYDYSRIYLLNPYTGAYVSSDTTVSMINVAYWNFLLTGAYNRRSGGTTPGNASGYTSTYDVEFDQQGNLYSQSYYGWTVEKWQYEGTLPTVNSVQEIGGTVPEGYRLGQNYPNPFNPTTTIEFAIPASGRVSLRVFDLLGREVAVLADEEMTAGTYRATFGVRELPSGSYYYTLRSGSFSETKRMVVLK